MLIGIVGRPSVGKSTFFKAATLADVEIASYPFTTIKPNHGIGYVKVECIDKEFKVQCQPREGFCLQGWRFVPVELIDVAGLVEGASEGKGLGNQFLDDLTSADAFIQVIDLSGLTNEEGKQTKGYYPGKDIKVIENELDKWYAGILKKVWKTFSRQLESENINFVEAVEKQFSGLKVSEEQIKKVIRIVNLDIEKPSSWGDDEIFKFARELRRVSKPMIIAANKADTEAAKVNLEKIKKEFDYPIIACSSEAELALKEASKDEIIKYIPGESSFTILKPEKLNEKQTSALQFIQKNVLDVYKSTGVQDVLNKTVFELLDYIAVFPAGVKKLADSKGRILPDCFLLKKGSTALDFAYKLHTDIGDNFVKAIDARTGKAVGKEYKLKNRDALEIAVR